jgi:hypothetical protein
MKCCETETIEMKMKVAFDNLKIHDLRKMNKIQKLSISFMFHLLNSHSKNSHEP